MSDIAYKIDLTYLESVTNNDDALQKQLVGLMLKETPSEVAALEAAFAEKNWPNVRAAAHKLKSTVNFFGIGELEKLTKELEGDAKEQKNLETIGSRIDQMKVMIDAGLGQLKALV